MYTLNIFSSVIRMKLIDGCHSLKLECALRDLGFVDIGWKCVANAGIFLVHPFGLPENPDGDLLGFQVVKSSRVIRLSDSAKKHLTLRLICQVSHHRLNTLVRQGVNRKIVLRHLGRDGRHFNF